MQEVLDVRPLLFYNCKFPWWFLPKVVTMIAPNDSQVQVTEPDLSLVLQSNSKPYIDIPTRMPQTCIVKIELNINIFLSLCSPPTFLISTIHVTPKSFDSAFALNLTKNLNSATLIDFTTTPVQATVLSYLLPALLPAATSTKIRNRNHVTCLFILSNSFPLNLKYKPNFLL